MAANTAIIGRVAVKVLPDTDNFRKDTERALKKIEGELKPVNINIDVAKSSLDKATKSLKKWRDKESPLDINVDLDLNKVSAETIRARLAFLTRSRSVEIIPHLNEGAVASVATGLAALSGVRVLQDGLTNVRDFVKELDKAAPAIALNTVKLLGLSAAGLALSSNLFALGSSLASIGGLMIPLPVLVGSFIVSIVTLVSVFDGFGKAVKKGGDALAALPPKMRAAANAVRSFKVDKTVLQETFWDGMAAAITRLHTTVFPAFQAGLVNTAKSLNGFAKEAVNALIAIGSPTYTQIFAGFTSSIDVATKGLQPFIHSIGVLGTVGQTYLPQLAQYTVDLANRFNNFISAAAGDGRLTGWVDNARLALHDLGQVIVNTVGIFSGLANAAKAAGGSSLKILGDALGHIRDVVDSPAFQTGLIAALQGAHQAMENIANISGPAVSKFFGELGKLLGAVLPQIGTIIGTALSAVTTALAQPEVITGIKDLISGVASAVTTLAPAMGPLGQAIGLVASALGTFVAALGPSAAILIGGLADAAIALTPVLSGLATLLAGALTGAIAALVPPVVGLIQTLAKIMSNSVLPAFEQILGSLLPVIQRLAPILADVLTKALDALVPIFPVIASAISDLLVALVPLIPVFLQLVEAVLIPLLPVITQLIGALLPPLAAAIAALVPALIPVITAITGLVNLLMPVLVPILKLVAFIITDTVITAINGVVNVFTGAVTLLTGVFDVFKGLFTGDWSLMWTGLKDIVIGIWKLIVGAFELLLTLPIFGIFGKFKGLLKLGWEGLWGAIKTFAVDIFNGIVFSFKLFFKSLLEAPLKPFEALKGLFGNVWTTLKNAATGAFGGIVSGLKTKLGEAITFVRGIPGQILAILKDPSALVSAGKNLIQGFINGIKSMAGDIIKAIKETITDKLPGFVKKALGIHSPSRVFMELGSYSAQGFVEGLTSQISQAQKVMQSLVLPEQQLGLNIPKNGIRQQSRVIAQRDGSAGGTKVFNYYAAPGQSLSSEDELFAATSRARMQGF